MPLGTTASRRDPKKLELGSALRIGSNGLDAGQRARVGLGSLRRALRGDCETVGRFRSAAPRCSKKVVRGESLCQPTVAFWNPSRIRSDSRRALIALRLWDPD